MVTTSSVGWKKHCHRENESSGRAELHHPPVAPAPPVSTGSFVLSQSHSRTAQLSHTPTGPWEHCPPCRVVLDKYTTSNSSLLSSCLSTGTGQASLNKWQFIFTFVCFSLMSSNGPYTLSEKNSFLTTQLFFSKHLLKGDLSWGIRLLSCIVFTLVKLICNTFKINRWTTVKKP